MDGMTFSLSKNEVFYTHTPGDAVHITQGEVFVYIAPWSEKEGRAGRRILLCECACDRVIPSFAWCDSNYTQWRFLIVAKTETAAGRVMPGKATLVLKRKFLHEAGIDTIDTEGYEGSLTEFYRSRELNENIFMERGEKDTKNLKALSAGIIESAVTGNSASGGSRDDILFATVRVACEKCGISNK